MEGRKREIENHKALWFQTETEKNKIKGEIKSKWGRERERKIVIPVLI